MGRVRFFRPAKLFVPTFSCETLKSVLNRIFVIGSESVTVFSPAKK